MRFSGATAKLTCMFSLAGFVDVDGTQVSDRSLVAVTGGHIKSLIVSSYSPCVGTAISQTPLGYLLV